MSGGDSEDSNWLPNFPTGIWWPEHLLPAEAEPVCECGVGVAMGKDSTPEFHSDYCPVYKKWKKDYGTKKDSK